MALSAADVPVLFKVPYEVFNDLMAPIAKKSQYLAEKVILETNKLEKSISP